MIAELDETIRQLLLREGGFDPNEVDVSFDLPNREWANGISKPTINCYLFDLHENREMRQSGMEMVAMGTPQAMRMRQPVRVQLTYLITAWTRQVEDEHRLLFQALYTLFRFPNIPDELRVGALKLQTKPLRTTIAQPDGVLKSTGEFWTALENHLKPSLSYTVDLAIDPTLLPAGPPVLVQWLRLRNTDSGAYQDLMPFGGVLRNKDGEPVAGAEVLVEGYRGPAITNHQGQYRLRVPGPGRYVLRARVNGTEVTREIEIPEPDFDVSL
jgi:hypothetical protein